LGHEVAWVQVDAVRGDRGHDFVELDAPPKRAGQRARHEVVDVRQPEQWPQVRQKDVTAIQDSNLDLDFDFDLNLDLDLNRDIDSNSNLNLDLELDLDLNFCYVRPLPT
jgi:hypothetical protein